MPQTLSWNLHGNDQLSAVLEKLDRTLGSLSRRIDGVTGDAKRMGNALGDAESPARRFASSAEHAESRLGGMSAGLAAVADKARFMGLAVAAAATAGAASVGMMGIRSAMAAEDAKISFEVMLGSAEKAAAFLKTIQDFASNTPFQFADLRTDASRLLAVGTATKDIIPLLTSLGDATAAMGSGAFGIERAITALTQMKQKTKVTGEEMMQLTEAGIGAWDALAAQLNTTVADAMKKVERREVDAGVIFEAIENRKGAALQKTSGLMDRQAKTLGGVISNFKDTVDVKLGKAFTPMLEPAKAFIGFLSTGIGATLDKLQSMGGQLGAIFKDSDVPERIFKSLKQLGEAILPKLEEAWNKILGTINNNKAGLEKLGRFLADFVIPLLGNTLIASIDMASAALRALIWVAAKVTDAFQLMAKTTLDMMSLIVHGAAAAWDWLPGLGPKLKDAEREFDDWANHVKAKLDALNASQPNPDFAYQVAGLREAERKYEPFTGRASGGPVWAGMSYVGGEFGPEPFIAATTGTVQPYRANSGSDSGQVFALDLTLRNDTGQVIYEKLLNFKANSGKVSLGF